MQDVNNSGDVSPTVGHADVEAKSAGDEKSFPTDQRARQKARKKEGHVVKKRPQVVENHHDDCGEDFGPLGDDYMAQEIFGSFEDHAEDFEEEFCCIVDMDHGLNGSVFDPEEQQDHTRSEIAMNFVEFGAFTTWSGPCSGEQSRTGTFRSCWLGSQSRSG